MLYIFWFLHQTTTILTSWQNVCWLYIFWFLHQTTTHRPAWPRYRCCISFDSYIKPQLLNVRLNSYAVVYLLIPTSNHNLRVSVPNVEGVVYLLIPTSNHNVLVVAAEIINVVYLLIPTSNHNQLAIYDLDNLVVYLLIPTSNHNWMSSTVAPAKLYIFWFLHQTTT